jgi:hypothetical protein
MRGKPIDIVVSMMWDGSIWISKTPELSNAYPASDRRVTSEVSKSGGIRAPGMVNSFVVNGWIFI